MSGALKAMDLHVQQWAPHTFAQSLAT